MSGDEVGGGSAGYGLSGGLGGLSHSESFTSSNEDTAVPTTLRQSSKSMLGTYDDQSAAAAASTAAAAANAMIALKDVLDMLKYAFILQVNKKIGSQ